MWRALLRLVALGTAGGLVSACGLTPPNVVTYTAYQLTCCTASDINQLWQPGATVELHWIVRTATTTMIDPSHKVVITATLMGPYSDVATLKHASGATHIVQGSVTTMDDPMPPPAGTSSVFLLPQDMPSGNYKLDLKWDFGHGSSAAAGSIVRVGTR